MAAFDVFGLVFSELTKRLAGKSITKVTFCVEWDVDWSIIYAIISYLGLGLEFSVMAWGQVNSVFSAFK